MAKNETEAETGAEFILNTPVYFNDIEPFAAEWLANLGKETHIDTRSIAQIAPADVAGFRRVHFFAGIGGWELALQLAGWPEDEEVWTGSCPCQPFSVAGKRGGTADERHLWPEFFRLIDECRPATIFGEQVASKDGLGWLDGVFADLEGAGYACGAADLCAAGIGAPHIRQRLFWVAYASGSKRRRRPVSEGRRKRISHAANSDTTNRLAITNTQRHNGREDPTWTRQPEQHHEAKAGDEYRWSNAAIIPCRDGKSRRISAQRGDEPLAYGVPRDVGSIVARLGELGFDSKTARRIIANARRNRTGRLRGYGNAIVPQVAVEFIRSVMETQKGSEVV